MAKVTNASTSKKLKTTNNLSSTKTKVPVTYTTKSSTPKTNASTSKPKPTTNNLSSTNVKKTTTVTTNKASTQNNASASKQPVANNQSSTKTKVPVTISSKPAATLAGLQTEKQPAKQETLAQKQTTTQQKSNTDYFSKASPQQQQQQHGVSGMIGPQSTAMFVSSPFLDLWDWWRGNTTGSDVLKKAAQGMFTSPIAADLFPVGGDKDNNQLDKRSNPDELLLSTIGGQAIPAIMNAMYSGLYDATTGGGDNPNNESASYGTTSGSYGSYGSGYGSSGYGGSYGSGGGSGSGGSSDNELTDEEKQAAENQTAIAKANIGDVQNQLERQLSIYDTADQQNKALADAQQIQASRDTSYERFEAQRALQQAARSLLSDMSGAINGNSTGNLMSMLRERNDYENNAHLGQLMQNTEQIRNSYFDTLNQNNLSRREAMQSAEKTIADITRNWAANMNNIDPSLYKEGPVGGDKKLAASTAWQPGRISTTKPTPTSYVLPDQSIVNAPTRNRVNGNDYFSRLINSFNRR